LYIHHYDIYNIAIMDTGKQKLKAFLAHRLVAFDI
jgi:hypothetical protein